MRDYNEILTAIQSQIYASRAIRTVAYYREGYGALFVPEGAPLTPANVIASVSEAQLDLLTFARAI